MTEVIITGANGLIGSSCCKLLENQYQFTKLDISDPDYPVDITDVGSVMNALKKSSATHLIHLAAFTDVTAAWQQSGDKTGMAYKVNVKGTENLVKACNETGKHIINVSTSYVFDGEKSDQYTELDSPNPIEWYGETKALAEKYIQEHADSWTIFRIDQPFKAEKFAKQDLAHKVGAEIQAHALPPQFEDHYLGPTWIPDFIKIIEWAVRTSSKGLYHASSGETWTNLEFAQKVAEILQPDYKVQSSKLSDYLKSNKRPYQKNTALNCQKLFSELDFTTISIASALEKVTF
jgi:dTDP-4-dehydrorhamnose reductase